ncbi:MAG: pentapeptide repeat-containing protein [Leptolyngbyaceae cyanobacterium SM1_1_3]|nr:pentapeptide repeat-containing protein [Leptolyngbyaceae cyanobacterium SM1_1_3]NJN03504.1 pentapeptide repeat-containing protein [Leptolyngbyaceae cyanobacterium RM1_1_2]
MKLTRILLTTLLVLIVLQAEVPIRVWRLRITKSCPGCRLLGVDIRDADLSGANLRNADLRWTRFHSVNLTNADLSGANLRNAQMNDVTIQNTEFCGATMMNAVKGYCRHSPTLEEGVSFKSAQ